MFCFGINPSKTQNLSFFGTSSNIEPQTCVKMNYANRILCHCSSSFCFRPSQTNPELKAQLGKSSHGSLVVWAPPMCFGLPRSAELLCNQEDTGRSRCSCPRAQANSRAPILGSHQTLLGCRTLSNQNGAFSRG